MCTFIEDYIQNPSEAIASAVSKAGTILWADSIDEDQIYQQIGTGSFRLYEELLDFSYLCTYDRYNDIDNNTIYMIQRQETICRLCGIAA